MIRTYIFHFASNKNKKERQTRDNVVIIECDYYFLSFDLLKIL